MIGLGVGIDYALFIVRAAKACAGLDTDDGRRRDRHLEPRFSSPASPSSSLMGLYLMGLAFMRARDGAARRPRHDGRRDPLLGVGLPGSA
jgi:uncharacterized membrane protein YdfJ with MMPL/SSD domain